MQLIQNQNSFKSTTFWDQTFKNSGQWFSHSSLEPRFLTGTTFLHSFNFAQLVNRTCKLAALFCCPHTPKTHIKYISTTQQGFDLGREAECQWNSAKKKYSSKSLKFNFLCSLGWAFQLITHKSLTLTAPIHRRRCLGRGQRKQRRLTNKQWVKKI